MTSGMLCNAPGRSWRTCRKVAEGRQLTRHVGLRACLAAQNESRAAVGQRRAACPLAAATPVHRADAQTRSRFRNAIAFAVGSSPRSTPDFPKVGNHPCGAKASSWNGFTRRSQSEHRRLRTDRPSSSVDSIVSPADSTGRRDWALEGLRDDAALNAQIRRWNRRLPAPGSISGPSRSYRARHWPGRNRAGLADPIRVFDTMLRKPTPLQSEKLPIIPDELAEALQAAPDGTSPKSTRPGLENGQKRAGLKNQLTRFRNVPTPATDHGHTAGHAALAVPKSPVPRDGAAAPASMRLPDIPSSPLNMGRVAAASRTSGSISSFELPNPRRASSAQESLASSTRSATRPAPIAPTVVPRDKAAAMEGPPSVAASGERLSGSRSDSSMQGLAFAPRDLPQERQRRSRASRSPEGRRRLGPSASFPPPSPYTTGSGLSPIDSALLEDSDPLAVINSRGAGRAPSPRPRDLPVPVSDTHALPAAGVRLGRTRASSLCRSTSDFSPLHPEPAERQSRRGRLRSSASAENLARLRPRPTPRRKQSGHVSDEDLDEIGQCQPEDEGRSSIYGDALADIHAEERMAASVLDRGGRHEAWRSEPATPAAGSEDGDETCWDDEEGPGWPRHEVFVHRLAERPRRSKHRRLSAASDSDSTSSADASPPGGPDRQHEQFEDAPADVGRQKTLRRPAVAAEMTRTSTELTPATLRYMAWTHAEELEKASRLAKGSGPARASSRRRPSDRLVHFVTDRLRSRSMSESDISRPSAAAIGLEDEQDPPTRRAEEQLDAERHAFAAVRHEEAQANATDRAEFTIAVVGPRGVGKSTIVRTAFGLSHAKPRVLQSDGVNMGTHSPQL